MSSCCWATCVTSAPARPLRRAVPLRHAVPDGSVEHLHRMRAPRTPCSSAPLLRDGSPSAATWCSVPTARTWPGWLGGSLVGRGPDLALAASRRCCRSRGSGSPRSSVRRLRHPVRAAAGLWHNDPAHDPGYRATGGSSPPAAAAPRRPGAGAAAAAAKIRPPAEEERRLAVRVRRICVAPLAVHQPGIERPQCIVLTSSR
jgi:hypothetical protein